MIFLNQNVIAWMLLLTAANTFRSGDKILDLSSEVLPRPSSYHILIKSL